MKVAVFGLGYVGSVTAAALARDGHDVVGVDTSREKIDLLNSGVAPVLEPGLGELLRGGVAAGRLRATADAATGLSGARVSLVCVGTPSRLDGSSDLSHLRRVAAQIGAGLRLAAPDHLLVVRSTLLAADLWSQVVPDVQQASGRAVGDGWDIAVNPEFMREGCSLEDHDHPPRIIVGERAPGNGALVLELYAAIEAPRFCVPIEVALAVKYSDNAFHALKVSFANEMARVWRKMGVEPAEVMDIVASDRKLNLSAEYLRPGFAFGGSCLPKDLRALTSAARGMGLCVPLLESILPSNQIEVTGALGRILATGCRRVALLGLAFKAGTDDARESPLVELARGLVDAGLELRIHDPSIQPSRLREWNRAFLQMRLPDVERYLCGSPEEAIADAELVVVGHPGALAAGPEAEWGAKGKRILRLA